MSDKTTLTMFQQFQESLNKLFNNNLFTQIIIALIVINGIVLGLQTYPGVMKEYGVFLDTLDNVILYIFVIELAFKLMAYGRDFFKDPWNLFDLTIVAISFAAEQNGAFAVLRVLRIFRVLRLISTSESLKKVVEGFLRAIPGLSSILLILLILFYISAVISTSLFGEKFPELFGSLENSLFSLFQIMTLESWSVIARDIMKVYPYAWIFFVSYILIVTFSILNLFIAVIVDSMQQISANNRQKD